MSKNHPVQLVTLRCPECDKEWQATAYYNDEEKRWEFREGRDCPECGWEGEYE